MQDLLIKVSEDYGIYGIIIIIIGFVVYGIYRIINSIINRWPEKEIPNIMKKIFPKRNKIMDNLGSTVTLMLETAANMEDISKKVSDVSSQLRQYIFEANNMSAQIQLMRELVLDYDNMKRNEGQDQLRKIDLVVRMVMGEALIVLFKYMIQSEGELNKLDRKERAEKADMVITKGIKVITDLFKEKAYKLLREYHVKEDMVNKLDKVLFELEFINKGMENPRRILMLDASAIEQFDLIKDNADQFHFNVLDRLERMTGIYLGNGNGDHR